MKTVEKFESLIAQFYGAKYAVATDCCTHAIELCLRTLPKHKFVSCPKNTYLSIPMTFIKLQRDWEFNDQQWINYYFIGNTNIVDAAVHWKENGYLPNTLMCLSFQYKKHLSLGRGGMILTDNDFVVEKLKKMSYDGRLPDVPWKEQNIDCMGFHYYMTPETAQMGIDKLDQAIKKGANSYSHQDYPDLSQMNFFKNYVQC